MSTQIRCRGVRHTAIRALTLAFLLTCCRTGLADEMDDAQAYAKAFLEKVDNGDLTSAWDANVSSWFKQRMTKAAFLANITMIRAQLGGGGSDRTLIQRNTGPGGGGDAPTRIFAFTFSTSYPGAKVYEVVVLAAEEGEYKVTGVNFVPNPN